MLGKQSCLIWKIVQVLFWIALLNLDGLNIIIIYNKWVGRGKINKDEISAGEYGFENPYYKYLVHAEEAI